MSVDKFIDDSMGDDNADMTPAQAAQMLEMAMSNGDTAPADSIDTPADTAEADKPAEETPAVEEKPAVEADEKSLELDETNAVLLARDGKHTIPFEQLTTSREETRLAKEAEAAARAELEALKAQYQSQSNTNTSQQEQDVDTAQAAINAGVDPSIFGDFDEEGIAKGIKQLLAAELKAALAPIEQQKQEAVVKSHWDTIFDAHKDADSVVESVEFSDWRKSQPSYANAAIDNVLKQGTAAEVVELLNNFKHSTNSGSQPDPKAPPVLTPAEMRAKAQEVINNTKKPVPTSLSDMPGRPGATAIGEQVLEMSGVDALDVMAGWSPEQINQHLNSL